MAKNRELRIQLYVVADSSYQGPISFDTYEHHKLRTNVEIASVFGLKPGDYRVFRPGAKDFVDLDRTYRELRVRENESLVLTDITDRDMIEVLCKAICKPLPEDKSSEKPPAINFGVGMTGPTFSTDILEWARRLRDRFWRR